ncbi:MAG: hypothetical protein ABWX74_00210, partial [Aeromicrobium sp.]
GLPLPGSATIQDVVLGRAGGPGAAPAWLTVGLLLLAVLALVPRSTRTGVHLAWLVALIGLGVALAGTVVTYSTPSAAVDVVPWVGVPTVLWISGLATAVLLAVPAVGPGSGTSVPRAVLATATVVALVLPVGTGVWWVARGMADPVDDVPSAIVPSFLAERPGDTLVVTGTFADGIDYRVVADDAQFLGQEAVVASSADSAPVGDALRQLLAQSSGTEVEALSRAGVDAIYAPDADAELIRRVDATPLLSPSGSDDAGSRVWVLDPEPVLDDAAAPWWHRAVIALQAVLWLVAIILTAPVRRRATPEPLTGDEETA